MVDNHIVDKSQLALWYTIIETRRRRNYATFYDW